MAKPHAAGTGTNTSDAYAIEGPARHLSVAWAGFPKLTQDRRGQFKAATGPVTYSDVLMGFSFKWFDAVTCKMQPFGKVCRCQEQMWQSHIHKPLAPEPKRPMSAQMKHHSGIYKLHGLAFKNSSMTDEANSKQP